VLGFRRAFLAGKSGVRRIMLAMLACSVFRRGYGMAVVGVLMVARGLRRGIGLRLCGKRFVSGAGVLLIIVFMIMLIVVMFFMIVMVVTVVVGMIVMVMMIMIVVIMMFGVGIMMSGVVMRRGGIACHVRLFGAWLALDRWGRRGEARFRTFDDLALNAVAAAAAARTAVPRTLAVGTVFGLFLGLAVGAFVGLDQGLTVGDRDLIIIGMDFAEGQKAVAVTAILDEGRLQ
jgi:hypothetical protein